MLYSAEIKLLLDNGGKEDTKEFLEYALNTACTFLEENKISPTYKITRLDTIGRKDESL